MKTKILSVLSTLAAVSIAAPQHQQTSINRAIQSPTLIQDICWLVCWPYLPTCPDGWYSNNKGTEHAPCWTCCMAPTGNSESTPVSSTPDTEEININIQINDITPAAPASSLFEDPCWRVCWHRIPKCPNGWYSNNKGTADHPCWTCCQAPGVIEASAPCEVTEFDAETDMEFEIEMEGGAEADIETDMQTIDATAICLKRCWHRRPRCPRGWVQAPAPNISLNRCWTCCRHRRAASSVDSTLDKEDITIDVQVDTTTTKSASSFQDPCWRVCWDFIPKCPDGWYPNNKGTVSHPCWTCCKAPTDSAYESHPLGLPVEL